MIESKFFCSLSPLESISARRSLPADLEEQGNQIFEMTEDFISEYLKPNLANLEPLIETDPLFVYSQIVSELNRRGFLSLWISKIFGGKGFHPLTSNIFEEEVAAHSVEIANIIGSHYGALRLIFNCPNYQIIEQIIGEILLGEKTNNPCLLSTAISEFQFGQEVFSSNGVSTSKLICQTSSKGQGISLTGRILVTSVPSLCRWLCIAAEEESELKKEVPGNSQIQVALISTTAKGLKIDSNEQKFDDQIYSYHELKFENCIVSSEYILLDSKYFSIESNFHSYSLSVINDTRSFLRSKIGVYSTGATQHLILLTLSFLNQNQNLKELDWVRSTLGQITKNLWLIRLSSWETSVILHIDSAQKSLMNLKLPFGIDKFMPSYLCRILGKFVGRSLCKRNFGLKENDADNWNFQNTLKGISSLCKFNSSEMSLESVYLAQKILAKNVTSVNDSALSKILNDVRLLQIYEGTPSSNKSTSYDGLLGEY